MSQKMSFSNRVKKYLDFNWFMVFTRRKSFSIQGNGLLSLKRYSSKFRRTKIDEENIHVQHFNDSCFVSFVKSCVPIVVTKMRLDSSCSMFTHWYMVTNLEIQILKCIFYRFCRSDPKDSTGWVQKIYHNFQQYKC
jgi:hypothetical protein